MSTIVPLAEGHCPEVARLHLEHLTTGFRGKPGLELLTIYYGALVQSGGGCGFVAEQAGRVSGYVCGVWEPGAVRRALLRGQWPALLFWGAAHLAVQPRFFYDLAGRLAGSAGSTESAGPGYELRPIVVTPSARGTGIGVRLVERLLGDADRRGFDRVHLVAAQDNATADAFYRKIGFRPAGLADRAGEAYVRYEYLLSSP